jgi:hypothetical protein
MRSLKVFILFAILPVFFATDSFADDIEALEGRSLLKAFRAQQGRAEEPSYETKKKELEKSSEKIEQAVTAAEEKETPITPAEPNKVITADVNATAIKPAEKVVVAPVEKAVVEPVIKPVTRISGDKILSMIPADALLVLRVNNIDNTLNQLDQFLGGMLPMPTGLSAFFQMNLAQTLGSPDLNSIDMKGSFTVFVLPPEKKQNENGSPAEPAGFTIMPMKDFKQFAEGNVNVGRPEPNGIFKITTPYRNPARPNPVILSAKQVDDFLLIGGPGLLNVSQLKANGGKTISEKLDSTLSKSAANEPVWLFVDTQKIAETYGDFLQKESNLPMYLSPKMIFDVNGADFVKKLNELQYISATLSPQPDALKVSVMFAASAGSDTANLLKADSPQMLTWLKEIGALKPSEAQEKLAEVAKLVPTAKNADFVGTFNLMKLITPANAVKDTNNLQTSPQAENGIYFAVKFGRDKLKVDIALPKQHVAEVMTMAMQIFRPPPQQTPVGEPNSN